MNVAHVTSSIFIVTGVGSIDQIEQLLVPDFQRLHFQRAKMQALEQRLPLCVIAYGSKF